MAAFIPAYERKNVLVGMARMFLAPYDEDTPEELPANTVALNGPWGGNWVPIGATQEGVTIGFTRETEDITIEEQFTPVDTKTSAIAFNISTVLSEDTLQTMKWAYGGGEIITTAADATNPGTQQLVISSELEHLTLGFEGVNKFGFWRRVLIPDVLSVGEIETNYRRAAEQRLYSTSFRSVVPIEDVVILEMTAEPTGP